MLWLAGTQLRAQRGQVQAQTQRQGVYGRCGGCHVKERKGKTLSQRQAEGRCSDRGRSCQCIGSGRCREVTFSAELACFWLQSLACSAPFCACASHTYTQTAAIASTRRQHQHTRQSGSRRLQHSSRDFAHDISKRVHTTCNLDFSKDRPQEQGCPSTHPTRLILHSCTPLHFQRKSLELVSAA